MVDKVLAMNLNTEQMKRYMGGKDPHKFTSKSSSISGPVSRSSESGEEQAAEEENSESSSDGENSSSSDYDYWTTCRRARTAHTSSAPPHGHT